jgi:hypothetical protein
MTRRLLAALLALATGCATARQPSDLVVTPAPYPDLPPMPEAQAIDEPADACPDPTPVRAGVAAPCTGLIYGLQDSADASAAVGSLPDVRRQLERLHAQALEANDRCELAQELLAARLIEAEEQRQAAWWRGLATGIGITLGTALGILIGAVAVGEAE